MFHILKKWNTLRNQLLVVFLFVMIIVLIIVSGISYQRVADLLQGNAEEQIKQTAVESNGRLDSLYEQINMVTKQVTTNEELQHILYKTWLGNETTFHERQSLMRTINSIQANADGIYSVEIYTKNYQRIIPIDATNLNERINPIWISLANESKGSLVWIGEDPLDDNYFLVTRRINLMDENFTNGGYMMMRISKTYFQLNEHVDEETKDYTVVVDKYNQTIASNYPFDVEAIHQRKSDTIKVNSEEYIVVENTSKKTGWTVYYLTPVHHLTKGMSIVLTGIIIAGLIGVGIFFISSFFLATFITRPITRLTQTMREAGQGVLAQNPIISSTNEINELNQTYNQLAAETNYLVRMVYEKEIMTNRTELKALQAQIHPHFLFNTLDALYWSLDEKDEEELAAVVLAMSELFRYTISKENQDEWVTVKEELDHIERYMQIMRIRFGDRLLWEKEVESLYLQTKIPKLLIQPLVENAILHGAGNIVGNCTITVLIEKVKERDMLRIVVCDNGPGMNQETLEYVEQLLKGGVAQQKGSGMALHNVEKRLELYYGDKGNGLTIQSEEDRGTTISFEIPVDGGEFS